MDLLQEPQWSNLEVFSACYIASAVCGLASYLKSDRDLNVRGITEAFIYSGCAGTVSAMLFFDWLGGREKWYRIVGLSGAIGLGYIKTRTIIEAIPRLINVLAATQDTKPNNSDDDTNDT